MEDAYLQNLANTLKGTGMAFSINDAMRMAKNIMGTEQKVSQNFNRVTEMPAKRKMTYQEEIDDLIKKTSPEYKNYHIPVKGYQRDSVQEKQVPKQVQFELEDAPARPEIRIELKAETMPLKEEEAKQVAPYSDALPDNKPLSQLMAEDMGDVMMPGSQELHNDAPFEAQTKIEEDFILKEEEPKPDLVQAPQQETTNVKTEELFKEIKEDKSKPHVIKNPIEAVDLMNYFKAG